MSGVSSNGALDVFLGWIRGPWMLSVRYQGALDVVCEVRWMFMYPVNLNHTPSS